MTSLNVLHTAAWALTIPFLLNARTYTEEPLKVLSPLGGGTYLVMTGGANFFVNQHVVEPSSKYAMDVTRLNAFGLRAAGMFPDELSKYAVFGTEIIAPCAGEVISAEDSLPNRMPLEAKDQEVLIEMSPDLLTSCSIVIEMPRMDASTSSTRCSIGSDLPVWASSVRIWSRQPGLLDATTSAPVARMFAAFRAPSAWAGSGSTRL